MIVEFKPNGPRVATDDRMFQTFRLELFAPHHLI